jgi:hypothetical protein
MRITRPRLHLRSTLKQIVVRFLAAIFSGQSASLFCTSLDPTKIPEPIFCECLVRAPLKTQRILTKISIIIELLTGLLSTTTVLIDTAPLRGSIHDRYTRQSEVLDLV